MEQPDAGASWERQANLPALEVGDLQGQVGIVTGACHGIGAATACYLADHGVQVVAIDIDPGVRSLTASHPQSSGRLWPQVADISRMEVAERLIADCYHRFGRIDMLINNAAVQTPGRITELSVDDWDAVHGVCLRAPFLLMKAVLPLMQSAGYGVIVNVASIHALVAYRRHPAYDSAKAGLVALTRQAAIDYGPDGIRTVAVSPGLILDEDVSVDARAEMFPVGRFGRPDEVAALIGFVCSRHAGFINGSNLVMDGGLTAASPAYHWHPPCDP